FWRQWERKLSYISGSVPLSGFKIEIGGRSGTSAEESFDPDACRLAAHMHRTQYPILDTVIAAVTAAATFKRTLYRKLGRKTKRAGQTVRQFRQQQACAADTSKNTTPTLSRDRGSLRKIFHATKLIDDPSARGEPANESS